MSVLSDARILVRLSSEAVLRRRDRTAMRSLLRRRGPLPERHFRAAVYFSDDLINTYQIEQWYEPLTRLAASAPLAVITRDIRMTRHLLEHCPLPVLYAQDIADVERWLNRQDIRAVFYVNQNNKNFPMLRFREPAHVFLSHGESDKDYMASNQLKAYDYTFIAGPAARERLRRRLIDYDVDARTFEVGRPQTDIADPPPSLPQDGRTLVIYAPTWEGDRPSMTYSSLVSHGAAVIDALTSDRRFRVVYRPHPRTGVADRRYRSAHLALQRAIQQANAADQGAHHLVDTRSRFGWHLSAGDVLIADISAVAYDWLATGKALVLTEPSTRHAVVDTQGLAARFPTLAAGEARNTVAAIERARVQAGEDAYLSLVRHYFGDTAPGASTQRFLDAALQVISRRDHDLQQLADRD